MLLKQRKIVVTLVFLANVPPLATLLCLSGLSSLSVITVVGNVDEAPKCAPKAATKFECGFSLPELLITLAVGLILAATSILFASTATNEVRLSSSGTNYANLLQSARMRAVRDDAFYQVLVDCGTVGSSAPCTGPTPARAFVDINGDGNYTSGEPVMTFATGVSPRHSALGPQRATWRRNFCRRPL